MVATVAGEVIAAFGGIAVCAPLLYQSQSLLTNNVRSPLRAATWHLWALGYLGLAAFFGHVPGQITHPHKKHSHISDAPASPRTLAVVGLAACVLCELCWALDNYGYGRRGRARAVATAKALLPAVFIVASFYYVLGAVHVSVARANPFYRYILAIVGYVMIAVASIGSILAVSAQSAVQLRRGGLEVVGLYWMPAAMQAIGYFAEMLDCVLLYLNVEWLGLGMLGALLATTVGYIAASRFKGRSASAQYGAIPVGPETANEEP